MTLRPSLERAGESVATWLRGLRGWRRFGVAFLSGAPSAFAFAPFGLFPLLLISFAVLVLLLDGAHSDTRPIWRSAVIGWACGFGQFLVGLYWVAYAFLVDPLGHAWQIPFVALLFPGGLAIFIAAACAVAAWLWREGASRIFVFTAAYVFTEWLRGHILTGFPWNIPGYGWGASLAVLQSVSMFGVYGLSLLTTLFGASLALLRDRGRTRLIPATMALLFVALWIGGVVRLGFNPTQPVSGVRLRLVQPNVPQDQKYLPSLRTAHWHQLLGLSVERKGPPPTHIIWPEAAPPFLLEHVPQALADIATLTDRSRVVMTGAARAEYGADGKLVAHNSFYVFGFGGALLARYDKFHLVPFGEYVPFPQTLHTLGIDRLVNQPGSFSSGDGPRTYNVPGAPPVGPLICYEIL
ncbi:MAG TPA: apolipoprotein N-acyltransferase, partial [Rhizomicrobium sp.]